MALYNRVRMTTATTGTGTITLGAAAAKFQTFAQAGVADGAVVSYVIEDGTEWEVGRGTYTASGTTLARTTVLESSNSDNPISLSGSAEVFISALAQDILSIGGSDTQIQFNDGGAFGGDSGLTFSKTTNTLAVSEDLATSTTTIDGLPPLVALRMVNDTNYWQLGYFSDAAGKIANYQTNNNTLNFSFYSTAGAFTGNANIFRYGGLSVSSQAFSGGPLGMYIKAVGTLSLGQITNHTTPGSNPTPRLDLGSSLATFNTVVAVAGGTVTTSTPVLDLSQTWNASGVTFTGLKLNVTDTASAAASLLLDLQVGGTTKFNVERTGVVKLYGSTNPVRLTATLISSADSLWVGNILSSGSDGQHAVFAGEVNIASKWGAGATQFNQFVSIGTLNLSLASAMSIRWANATTLGGAGYDTHLYRDAANTLAQRNGTNAQESRVYSTYTDASNNAYLSVSPAQIKHVLNGTGTLPAVTASTPVLDLSQTWNNSGVTFTGLKFNVTSTASAAASLLLDLQVGGASMAKVDKTGALTLSGASSGASYIYGSAEFRTGSIAIGLTANGGATFGSGNGALMYGGIDSEGMRLTSGLSMGFTSGSVANALDTILRRDAAGTLAQRNGTNAQALRVYNTYTDASNYEYGGFEWASNVLKIGTQKAGTGASRIIDFYVGGTQRAKLEADGSFTSTYIISSGGILLDNVNGFRSDNVGILIAGANLYGWRSSGTGGSQDTALIRAAAKIIKLTDGSTGGGALQLQEMTAPTAPATNNAIIFAEDNGAGKTRIVVRFPTGADVVLATEA